MTGLTRCRRADHLTEPLARTPGRAGAATGTSDVVDASVLAGAAARGDRVVTSDPDDLQRIIDVLRLEVDLITI